MAITASDKRVVVVTNTDEKIDLNIETRKVVVDVRDRGLQGPPGPPSTVPGPPGPPGPAGGEPYTHNQLEPADTWVITHNLGRFPVIEIVDSANSVVEGDVFYQDNNTIIVSFGSALGGKAYM